MKNFNPELHKQMLNDIDTIIKLNIEQIEQHKHWLTCDLPQFMRQSINESLTLSRKSLQSTLDYKKQLIAKAKEYESVNSSIIPSRSENRKSTASKSYNNR